MKTLPVSPFADLPAISPGSRRLKNSKHERYCRLRAALQPRAQTFREAGWNDSSDEGAHNHACRLEHRPGVSPGRVNLKAAGNPDVLKEAEGQPANPRYRSGPGWTESMRAWGGPQHHPGKNDGKDIGRRKPITY
jgi:hypothetical protein